MAPASSLAAPPAGAKAKFTSETKLPDGKQKDAPSTTGHLPCTIVTPPDRNIPVEFAGKWWDQNQKHDATGQSS
jgi:hypothetical protein